MRLGVLYHFNSTQSVSLTGKPSRDNCFTGNDRHCHSLRRRFEASLRRNAMPLRANYSTLSRSRSKTHERAQDRHVAVQAHRGGCSSMGERSRQLLGVTSRPSTGRDQAGGCPSLNGAHQKVLARGHRRRCGRSGRFARVPRRIAGHSDRRVAGREDFSRLSPGEVLRTGGHGSACGHLCITLLCIKCLAWRVDSDAGEMRLRLRETRSPAGPLGRDRSRTTLNWRRPPNVSGEEEEEETCLVSVSIV
jgi:hypothetical protein